MLFGCLALDASTGVSFAGGWQAVDSGETRVYLRNGAVVAADHRGWLVDYDTPASADRATCGCGGASRRAPSI